MIRRSPARRRRGQAACRRRARPRPAGFLGDIRHGLIAAYLDKDLDTALERYERALTVNPSAVSAWAWSASANAWLGNGAKAVGLIQRAIELSPLDPHMYSFASIAGAAEASCGNYDAAIKWARRSLRENRMFTSSHRVLTIALTLSGQVEEGRAAATELMALEPGLTVGGFRKRYPGSESAHVEKFCEALAAARGTSLTGVRQQLAAPQHVAGIRRTQA